MNNLILLQIVCQLAIRVLSEQKIFMITTPILPSVRADESLRIKVQKLEFNLKQFIILATNRSDDMEILLQSQQQLFNLKLFIIVLYNIKRLRL